MRQDDCEGVRFNAEKRQHGAYYTTKIWTFRMKTPCCKSVMEIGTDPKNTDYIVVKVPSMVWPQYPPSRCPLGLTSLSFSLSLLHKAAAEDRGRAPR